MIRALARRFLGLGTRRCASYLEHDWVTLPDGVRLATHHYWPVDAPEAPVLLTRTPYDASGLVSRLLGRLLAESGYHVVVQDVRGRYGSEGKFEPFVHEIEDGGATLAWLGEQSWCRGPIGLYGASYTAYTAWAALGSAQDGPGAAVGAMAAAIGSSDLYATFYPGGAFSLATALEWGTAVGDAAAVPARHIDLERGLAHRPTREADRVALRQVDPYRAWVDHPRRDAFWNALLPPLPTAPPPTLLVAGWYDFFLGPQLADYARLAEQCREQGLAGPELLIGPWAHGRLASRRWRSGNGFPRAYCSELVGFFDRILRAPSCAGTSEPVRYFCAERGWQESETWPPPCETREIYLSSSDARDPERGGELSWTSLDCDLSEEVFEYDPESPVPSLGGALFGPRGGATDQSELASRQDVLCYTSPPLESAVEIAGPVRLVLHIAADAPDADISATLTDLAPDDTRMNVCQGMCRARWRDVAEGDEEPHWLEPGQPERLEIDLWSTAWRFETGHRLQLLVSGSSLPRFDRSSGNCEPTAHATRETMCRVVLRVLQGADRRSRLELPLVSEKT